MEQLTESNTCLAFLSMLSLCGFLVLCANCLKTSKARSRRRFDVLRQARDARGCSIDVGQAGNIERSSSVPEQPGSPGVRVDSKNGMITETAVSTASEPMPGAGPSDDGDDDGRVSYVNVRSGEDDGTYIEVLPTNSDAKEVMEEGQEAGSYENIPLVSDISKSPADSEQNDYENVSPDRILAELLGI